MAFAGNTATAVPVMEIAIKHQKPILTSYNRDRLILPSERPWYLQWNNLLQPHDILMLSTFVITDKKHNLLWPLKQVHPVLLRPVAPVSMTYQTENDTTDFQPNQRTADSNDHIERMNV